MAEVKVTHDYKYTKIIVTGIKDESSNILPLVMTVAEAERVVKDLKAEILKVTPGVNKKTDEIIKVTEGILMAIQIEIFALKKARLLRGGSKLN